MLKVHVSRSIEINAAADRIYMILGDFNHWKHWWPWLTLESDAKLKVSENAKYFEWEGKRIGSGSVKVMNETYLKSVECDLSLFKPWKSESKIAFNIQHNGDSCVVTWEMDTSLPLFLFWKKDKMQTYVGMDYERGLEMLKDYIELGEIPSAVSVIGENTFDGIQYIGINVECSFNDLATNMKENFGKMRSYLEEQKALVLGVGFSVYNNWDFKKGMVNYTSGFSVSTIPEDLATDFISGSIPKAKVFSIEHKGAYRHIGNAWALSVSLSRAKIFNLNRNAPFFETYINNPNQVSEKELVTLVHFPLK